MAKLPALYDLTTDYLAVLDAALDADPEDAGLFEAALAEVEDDITEKVDGCVRVMKHLETQALAVKKEEQRLAGRRKALDGRASRLKAYVKECMEMAELKKLQLDLFTVAIQNSPKRVVLDVPPDQLPERFRFQPPVEADKAQVKTALLSGSDAEVDMLEGLAHIEQDTHLRIR